MFLDALPTQPSILKTDVMTPHYSPYYQNEEPPADWHSPNPIPFLVVEADQPFVFGVLPRRPDEQSRRDCSFALEWLEAALAWTGAGAETATGYGRFAPDTAAQGRYTERLEGQQQEAELAAMDPIMREMMEDDYEDSERFMNHLTNKWLPRLREAEGEEKRVIARYLATWYETHRGKDWRKPKGKNVEKVALIRDALEST